MKFVVKVRSMKSSNLYNPIRVGVISVLVVAVSWTSVVQAVRPGWTRKDVSWLMTGSSRIKGIYFDEQKAPTFKEQARLQKTAPPKKITRIMTASQRLASLNLLSGIVSVTVIDSPPVDGFVPWVVVSVTDKRLDELEFDAVPESSVIGRHPVGVDSQTDYVVGIFDTGASAHVIGHADATKAGLFNNRSKFITSNTSVISGVLGTVDAWVSQPLGLFVDGLSAIDPDGLLRDASNMRGESNVAIMIGQNPGDGPDLPTAIGTPLSVFFTTAIQNDTQITISHNGENFKGPDIHIYDKDDPQIPSYPNIIPLELRPSGAAAVQYIPSLEGFFEFPPMSPSVIIGNLAQSLFFVHSVDLVEQDKRAIDKDGFMLDTGAQVSVIGSKIAARLALDISSPNFEVEIQDVTGETVIAPGFYIDSVDIPALGEWLSFTNVPVVLLDISSPEGGTLDGVIGMNLFVSFNLVLRGGGLFLEDDPVLEFEYFSPQITVDIAPEGGDGIVNFLDFAVFADAWHASSGSANWNPKADVAPPWSPDGSIDLHDLAVFAEYWLSTAGP